MIEFPDLQDQLKQHIYRYNDKQKRFMLKSMRKVEFFNGIGDNATHDIMYSFIGENFSKDDYLQEPGDNATNLYFLQEGVIEIETKCDDIDFTLEKLFRGSVINYRTFFMEEDGQVYYKFGKNSILFTLAYEKMEELCKKHEDLNKKFQKFKQQTIMKEKPFPLDYIMELPKHLRDKTRHMMDFSKRLELENRLKNIVIRMLVDIRAKKAKPSLKDMINQYLKKKAEKDERARIRIKEQVLEIYEQKNFEQIEENDPNFNKIIVHIERVLKITTAQTLAIDSLERKIAALSKRKIQSVNRDMNAPKPDDKKKVDDAQLESIENDPAKQERDERLKKDFPNIQEDKFDSDDDDDYDKNKQLEQISNIIPKNGTQSSKGKAIGEKGDIINKFKAPTNQNGQDLEMALPDDSDSSKFSSEDHKEKQDQGGN